MSSFVCNIKEIHSCQICYSCLDLLLNEISVIFSDLLLPNEMSGYTENISTLIFFIHLLVLSYEPGKVSRTAMAHPVCDRLFRGMLEAKILS